jgi:prepilin-type N-terminal cleavage/methylation domain-containing protein
MSLGSSERLSGEKCRGMTLIETLIGALIFALVITGVYVMYTTMQNTMSRGQLMSDLQQNARIGLAQMTQEIRMTGYDPSGVIPLVTLAPQAANRAATPGCFSFVADVTGSGSARQITYDFIASSLRRRQDKWNSNQFSGGSAQPLAQPVVLLSFTYYDANNQVLTPAPSTWQCPPNPTPGAPIMQLTFDQMRLIRRIAIVLRVGDWRPGICPPNLPPPQPCEFFTLTSDVRLRNF